MRKWYGQESNSGVPRDGGEQVRVISWHKYTEPQSADGLLSACGAIQQQRQAGLTTTVYTQEPCCSLSGCTSGRRIAANASDGIGHVQLATTTHAAF
jgi:hypothetical protein